MTKQLEDKLQQYVSHLHHHPEISWEEHETTNYLVKVLEEEGLSPKTFDEMTGLYVDIGAGEPKVGFRVDIDALWQEVDGEYQANHSCGHDGHMTVGLGVAISLKEIENDLPYGVRIIFQPAEETGEGAKAILATGIIEPLQYLFGMHVRPLVELELGTYAATIEHGAGRMVTGEIIGTDAHGARPEQGTNAIEVASAIVEGMKRIWISPMDSASIKMTNLQAGGMSTNIIPGTATFSIDIRAQKNEVMKQLLKQFEKVIDSVRTLYDVDISYQFDTEIVAAQVDKEAKACLEAAIKEVVGEDKLVASLVTPGGEDFHYYTYENPTLKATMLGLGCGVVPGLHHPDMTFDRSYLAPGVQITLAAIKHALNSIESSDQ